MPMATLFTALTKHALCLPSVQASEKQAVWPNSSMVTSTTTVYDYSRNVNNANNEGGRRAKRHNLWQQGV